MDEERGDVIQAAPERPSRQPSAAQEDVLQPPEVPGEDVDEVGAVIRPSDERPSRQPSAACLTPERLAEVLAYCKLTELADDPEVQTLIPVFYAAAVGYMENAGITVPESGTSRAAQYDLVVAYMVLDAWERRETAMVATVVADNPAFRRLITQLKLTEPGTSFGSAERLSRRSSTAQEVVL